MRLDPCSDSAASMHRSWIPHEKLWVSPRLSLSVCFSVGIVTTRQGRNPRAHPIQRWSSSDGMNMESSKSTRKCGLRGGACGHLDPNGQYWSRSTVRFGDRDAVLTQQRQRTTQHQKYQTHNGFAFRHSPTLPTNQSSASGDSGCQNPCSLLRSFLLHLWPLDQQQPDFPSSARDTVHYSSSGG